MSEQSFRKCLAIAPDRAEAFCNLGNVLVAQARYEEGLASLRRGQQLGINEKEWGYELNAKLWIAKTEWYLANKGKLDELVSSFKSHDLVVQRRIAEMCEHRSDFKTAAAIYSHIFDQDNNEYAPSAFLAAKCGLKSTEVGDEIASAHDEDPRLTAIDLLIAHKNLESKKINFKDRGECVLYHDHLTRLLEGDEWASVRGDSLATLPDDLRKRWSDLWEEVSAIRDQCASALRFPEDLGIPKPVSK